MIRHIASSKRFAKPWFRLPAAIALAVCVVAGTTGLSRPVHRVCGVLQPVPEDVWQKWRGFLDRIRIRYPRATAGTLWHVHRTGRLPRCYLTKGQARRRGWRPGRNLWQVARGHAIGGNRFGNRERRLPQGYRYVEADLDFRGGRRGARRLVFARSTRGRWRMWVTMDHYRTFHRVPDPR